MEVVSRTGEITTRTAGALIVGVHEGARTLSGAAARVDRATRGALSTLLASRDFRGAELECVVLHPRGLKAPRLIVVGLGREAALDPERVRLAAALGARRARELKAKTAAFALPARDGVAPADLAHAAAMGAVLGHYRHTAYRSDPGPAPLRRVEIVSGAGNDEAAARAAVERGMRWGEAVCLARDLARTPGQDLTPEGMGARAVEIARATGARARVFAGAELERLGMGALIAVGRGSAHPPRFIVLERDAAGAGAAAPGAGAKRAGARGRAGKAEVGEKSATPTVVVIGKGVTFDTGGISLKPAPDMHRMKYDMSGGAAVLALFSALPTLDLPFRVVGLVPTAENMPGSRALKPGDVVRAITGTTIEVVNTDAEGRLLLADALGYSRRLDPIAVVDLATLTGSIRFALGDFAAGLFSADERLAGELLEASRASGERLWRMPLWKDYEQPLASDTADLINAAGREGGASIAAAFLWRFAPRAPWAHLDIASVAWSWTDKPLGPRGPNGFGVQLLLEWLSARAGAASAKG